MSKTGEWSDKRKTRASVCAESDEEPPRAVTAERLQRCREERPPSEDDSKMFGGEEKSKARGRDGGRRMRAGQR